MVLSVDYLEKRHRYWIERISAASIWEAAKFRPVKMIVRKFSSSYDGLFHRKVVKINGVTSIDGRIIIYQQYPDISQREIDDTLVHEIIHQYIFQNNLHDSSTHGRLFREFMRQINAVFHDELNITVYSVMQERRGPGAILHRLLLVRKENGDCYCCRINPNKVEFFLKKIELHKSKSNIKDYLLCESNDRYFDSFTACRKLLSGVRMTQTELNALCEEYNLIGTKAR